MPNYSIDGTMFKRRGAWFGIFQRGSIYGDVSLNLGTCHGMSAKAPDRSRLINIFPTVEGRKVPYTVSVEPAELTITTNHGSIRFTFANTRQLLAEGDPGMGLLFEKTMVQHETVHPKKNGAWEAVFRLTSSFIFKGLEGSTFDFNDGKNYWDWEKLSSGKVQGRTHPGPDGRFTLVMEEFPYGGIVRDSYPKYADAKASMQAEWDSFLAAVPPFKGGLEEQRAECLYTLWSYLTSPNAMVKYPMIQMFAGVMASQWQMCQNAVALQDDMDLALGLLLNPLERRSPEGQLADGHDDFAVETQLIKPPIHGWALLQIMKRHDIAKEWPREKIEELYAGLGPWAEWFMNYRDDDGDGLPTLDHGDETGLDDSTMFLHHLQLTTPDIAAYLVLLYEAVGKLAQVLGKPEAEAEGWFGKSKALLKRLVDKLWDGEHFIAFDPYTGEKIWSGSLVHYMPCILGDRLPREIIDKMAADLSDEAAFNSPFGLASENMQSDYFYPNGMSIGRGVVVPPAMLYICTGLWETHRREDARVFAQKYCDALRTRRFPFLINPKNGFGSGYFGGSWPRNAYMTLSRMLSE